MSLKPLLIPTNVSTNNLDLIRFGLASSVIYSHCYVICYGKITSIEPFMIFTRNQIDLGGFAVNCFFILSGFLIVRSFDRSTIHQYLRNRLLRIFPGFVVAFSISLFLVGPLGTINADHPVGDWVNYFQGIPKKLFLGHLFTFQKPISPPCFKTLPLPSMVNEPLWTIHYEVLCYLAIPILAALNLVGRKWLFLGAFITAFLILALQDFAHLFLWKEYNGKLLSHPVSMPRLFTYFLAGTLVYYFRNHLTNSRFLAFASVAALVFACVGYRCINVVMPFAGTYLLFYVAYHPRLNFSDFARKGDFSYGMYLYGWPVQQLLLYFLGEKLDPFRLFFLALPLSYGAAYLSWNLVEKPFLKLKKSKAYSLAPAPENAL